MPTVTTPDVSQATHLDHGAFHAEAVAVSADGVSRILSCSTSHVYAMHNAGRLPLPFRIGSSVRWDRAELTAWVAAGAPSREKWQAIKAR